VTFTTYDDVMCSLRWVSTSITSAPALTEACANCHITIRSFSFRRATQECVCTCKCTCWLIIVCCQESYQLTNRADATRVARYRAYFDSDFFIRELATPRMVRARDVCVCVCAVIMMMMMMMMMMCV
jgi:hypothetical protein